VRARWRLALALLAAPLGAQPHESTPRGTVRGDAFESRALGVRKHFMIYLPPGYDAARSRRYPVAYYLHGLGGRESDWLAVGAIDAVADSLIGSGMRETIIVMPDGDDSWYSAWVDPQPHAACVDSLVREAPERGCVRRARYDDYVARDLVAYVDARYRTLADRRHRGIGGLSMGGYGALKLALAYPETFAAAASHSGTVSRLFIGPRPFAAPPRYATTVDTLLRGYFARTGTRIYGRDLAAWQASDPATLAARLLARGTPVPALYVDCGVADELLSENRALDHELTRLGIGHRYHEHPGGHTWRYWNTHVRTSLAWMLGVIGPSSAPGKAPTAPGRATP
jgi:S-formylglutathione hydrolase FrmB